MKKTLIKIFAILSVLIILCFTVAVPTFAAPSGSQPYTPIIFEFSNFGSALQATAFPGAHSVPLYSDGNVVKDYLNDNDFYNEQNTHIKYGDLFNTGTVVPYIQVHLSTNFSQITVNGGYYPGTTSTPVASNLLGITTFDCRSNANSYNSGTTYYYLFNIVLGEFFDYDTVYQEGFDAGKSTGYTDGYNKGVEVGREQGFTDGYNKGVNASESAGFGENLLGHTLSAPMNALNSFTLFNYTGPYGTVSITLGQVVGGVIALTLFIAFLKIFSGG